MTDSAQRRAALIVATASSFFTPFMGSSVNIALPSIGEEFGLDAMTLSWVAASAVLAAAVFLVPFGRYADIHGRKKVFFWGVVLYTGSALLCSAAISAPMLIASRFAQGMGGAMIFGTGIAILTSVYPAKERGKALGIAVAGVYLGLTLGPSLGGFLTYQFGWRSVFLFNVPIGLVVLWFLKRLEGEWIEARGERFDLAGASLYSLALMAIIYGFSRLPGRFGGILILVGIAGIFTFISWEARAQSPLLDLWLFRRNRSFAFSNFAALINYSATFGVGFLLSLYLQYISGLSSKEAGLVLMAQPILMALVAPISGSFSDRIRPQTLATFGMGLTFLSLITFTFLDENTPMWSVVVSLSILGLGVGLFSSPNTNAVMSAVESKFYGVASSTLGTMRLTGHMFSMGIVMLAFSLYMGRIEIEPAHYALFLKSARVAFLVFSALSFGGIFASWVGDEKSP